MNTFSKYIFILLPLFFLGSPLIAQEGSNPLAGKDTIQLENERILDVIDSEKPNLNPPKPKLKAPSLGDIRYESKQFPVYTDFEPAPPKAQSVEIQEKEVQFNNMLRVGAGRFSSPHVQLYLNNGQDRDFDYGLYFNHFSTHNDVVELREMRENEVNFSGSVRNGINKLYGSFNFFNTAYSHYGDTASIREGRIDSLQRNYTYVTVKAGLQSTDSKELYGYDLPVQLRSYTGNRDNREFHFLTEPQGSIFITEDVAFKVYTGLHFVSATIGGNNANRTILSATPMLSYEGKLLNIQAGFNWNRYTSQLDTMPTTNFGPAIDLSYLLFKDVFTLALIGGYSTNLNANHYSDMIRNNPYVATAVDIRPSVETINTYGGIKGNIGDRFDYTAKVYFKRTENQLVYTIPLGGAYFEPQYDSLMTTVGIFAEVNYDIADDIKAGASLNFNNYSTTTFEKYFNAAPLRLDVYGQYVWNDKLTVKSEVEVFTATPVTLQENGDVFTRSSFVQLNVLADYRIIERFSVYAAVNNLLSGNFERWHNYPERPIDIRGGVSFIF